MGIAYEVYGILIKRATRLYVRGTQASRTWSAGSLTMSL